MLATTLLSYRFFFETDENHMEWHKNFLSGTAARLKSLSISWNRIFTLLNYAETQTVKRTSQSRLAKRRASTACCKFANISVHFLSLQITRNSSSPCYATISSIFFSLSFHHPPLDWASMWSWHNFPPSNKAEVKQTKINTNKGLNAR